MTETGNILIAGLRNLRAWAALIVLVLVSCHDDNRFSMERTTTLYPVIARNVETIMQTRAVIPVESNSVTVDYPEVETSGTYIRVYAAPTDNTKDCKPGTFSYSGSNWHSTTDVEMDVQYCLYAYAPARITSRNEDDVYTDRIFEDIAFDTSNRDRIQFSGLRVLTTADPWISVAATGKHTAMVNSVEKEVIGVNQYTDLVTPTLTKGSFNIGTVTASSETEFYKVWMAMEHLYAKASVKIYVAADDANHKYNEIRDIRVNSAKISVENGSLTYTGRNAASPTRPNSYVFTSGFSFGAGKAFGKISEDGQLHDCLEIDLMKGPTKRDGIFDEGETYSTLIVEPDDPTADIPANKPWAWFCFLPNSYLNGTGLSYPDVKLIVNYDICDKEGREIRTNQTVENKFSLTRFASLKNNDGTYNDVQPGQQFDITVTVRPTYLYQLIDDDAKLKLDIANIE